MRRKNWCDILSDKVAVLSLLMQCVWTSLSRPIVSDGRVKSAFSSPPSEWQCGSVRTFKSSSSPAVARQHSDSAPSLWNTADSFIKISVCLSPRQLPSSLNGFHAMNSVSSLATLKFSFARLFFYLLLFVKHVLGSRDIWNYVKISSLCLFVKQGLIGVI